MQKPIINLARTLRKNLTLAERKLWRVLKNRQLQGLRFRRQVLLGSYILDFACLNPKIIIEIDGGQHNEEICKQYDEERTRWLEKRGYKVLRFWNNQVLSEIEVVLVEILSNLSPHPSLPPEGEGTTS